MYIHTRIDNGRKNASVQFVFIRGWTSRGML